MVTGFAKVQGSVLDLPDFLILLFILSSTVGVFGVCEKVAAYLYTVYGVHLGVWTVPAVKE